MDEKESIDKGLSSGNMERREEKIGRLDKGKIEENGIKKSEGENVIGEVGKSDGEK